MAAIQLVPREFVERAKRWQTEAAEMRRISPVNPVADTLAYCAGEILETAKLVQAARSTVSTREYAIAHGVKVATVRKWCATGRLAGEKDAHGDYQIPLGATVTRTRRQRATG